MLHGLRRLRIGVGAIGLVVVPWLVVAMLYVNSRMMRTPSFDSDAVRQVEQLAGVLDAYRGYHGEFPPDFTSEDPIREIVDHFAVIFPNWDPDDLPSDIESLELGPHNALEFWLKGFYPDEKYPLTGIPKGLDVDNLRRETSYQPYSYLRLLWANVDSSGHIRVGNDDAPLIYFRSSDYATAHYESPRFGVALPYMKPAQNSTGKAWECPDSFQLISAGADNRYGNGRLVTGAGAHRFASHSDNLVNFSTMPLGHSAAAARIRGVKKALRVSPLVAIVCTVLYGFSLRFRDQEDGLVILKRTIQKRCSETEPSERWSFALRYQRDQYKKRAIDRLRTYD